MRKIHMLEWLTLMLAVLVMGVLWGTWFALSRSITDVSPQVFLGIGQTSIANLSMPMRILMPAAIISLVILAIVVIRKKQLLAKWLVLTALACMIGVIVVTLAVAVPIDNQIKLWSVQSLPDNWTVLRDQWQTVHTIRTFLSIIMVGALAAYLVTKTTAKTNPGT
jgi:uncharacterized membrane protein